MMGFKTRTSVIVASLAAAVMLIVASCGGGADKTPTANPATPTVTTGATATSVSRPTPTPVPATPTAFLLPSTATPTPVGTQIKTGGSLTIRSLRSWDIRDTYDIRGKFSLLWVQNMLSNLVKTDFQKPAVVLPDTAQSWDVTNGGKTYTFRLRPGIKWSDGTPYTAKDVLFNFDRAKNPSSPLLASNLEPTKVIESMDAPDDLTFRVNLKQPSAYFLAGVAAPFFLMYPSHLGANVAQAWGDNMISTGPFLVKDFKFDISALLVRNPNYYGRDPQGRPYPYLDSINLVFIPDNTAATAAFRTGRIDCGCETDFVTPLGDEIKKSNTQVTVINFSQDAIHYFFNNRPPFNDIRVRQAVQMAIDFDEINRVSRGGKAFYPPTFILGREFGGSWALSADEMSKMPGYRLPKDQDVAEAKRLLAAAGVDPSKTKLKVQAIAFYADFSDAFVTALRKQGWDLDVQLPTTSALSQALSQGDFDISFQGGGRTIDDPQDITGGYILTKGGQNFGKWSFPVIDQLFAQQDQELDPAKRALVIADMLREVAKQLFYMPALNIASTRVLYPQVKGYLVGAFSASSNLRFEHLWADRG
ncbi:MAG: ABC transporter substrate-binding protein [Chloroflexi bacterium]|nr:ABC transporter substrate-binding protein [Chloroflexota bacterium]